MVDWAVSTGNIFLVKRELKKDNSNTTLNYALIYAARGGYFDIVKFLVQCGANQYANALAAAAEGGHVDIINYFLGKTTNYDSALCMASGSGHLDIVESLVEKGAKNFNSAIVNAVSEYTDVVEYLLKMGANNYDEMLIYTNNQEIIDLINVAKQGKFKL